jgi:hypothetical protein
MIASIASNIAITPPRHSVSIMQQPSMLHCMDLVLEPNFATRWSNADIKKSNSRNIIHIHNYVMWDKRYYVEYFHIHYASYEYPMEYSHITKHCYGSE